MKNIIILCSVVLCSATLSAQKLFTSFYAGSSNYQGDLSEKLYDTKHSHFSWGLGFLYELNDHMLLRADFTYGKISGNDADGVKNRKRNLSFSSNVTEFSFAYEYTLLSLYNYKVSPYFFAGLSVYRFSPYTKDKNGNQISLFELDTEGQGFYKDRKEYKLTQFVVPFGGGVQWAVSDNFRIGFVIGVRSTFTDYLDDVSKTYIDKDLLRQKRGNSAVDYAYRGDELANADPYPTDGTQRGNPANNDWYYFSGITLRVRLPNIHSRRKSNYKVEKSRISCPRPV